MDQQTNAFLEKIKKKLRSSDAGKRVKCITEIVKHMELSDDYIVEGMEYLITLLKDKDPWVRKESLKCIEGIVEQVMAKLEKDQTFMVRYKGKMVPLKKLLFYEAIQLTKDDDPGIRLEAVTIAGEKSLEYPIIREKATPFLVARIRDDDKSVRNAAITYLIKISQKDPDLTRPFFLKLYKGKKRSTDVYVTYILDKVMIKHPMPEFIPLMFSKLSDADINTEKYILSALTKSGTRNMDDLHDYIVEALTDHSHMLWWVPARNMLILLQGIAEKDPTAVKPYLRYILPLMTDENREVRRHAVECIARMGAGDPDRVKEALATMVDLVRDPDNRIKEAAHTSLHMIGIKDSEFEIVRDSSRSLNQARLIVMDLKKKDDLTEFIRNLYVRSRKAFSERDFQSSLELSSQAIIATKTRNELRQHARESIQALSGVLQDPHTGGSSTLIQSTFEQAKKAFHDRKYFLAHELIYRSSRRSGDRSSGESIDPIRLDPAMESTVDSMVCHACGERISKGNTNCSGCGEKLDITTCRKCNAHVPQGHQFCEKCDSRLDHVCGVCGAINDRGDSTCSACGTELSHTHGYGNPGLELDLEIIPQSLDLKNVPE